MLTGTLNKIREERAEIARDIEYIREMVNEDEIDDRMIELEYAEMSVENDEEMYAEAVKMATSIPTDDGFKQEEINRILNADHDLTFDEMLGVE